MTPKLSLNFLSCLKNSCESNNYKMFNFMRFHLTDVVGNQRKALISNDQTATANR